MNGPARARGASRLGSWSKLGITLGALGLGLVACELFVRIADLAPPPIEVKSGSTLRGVEDPTLRFENQPGAIERLEYRDTPDAPPRVVEMRVNEHGFRGRRVLPEKREGTLRIACIGDSHTFGYGVADDETWPVALEGRLRSIRRSRSIEVMNCGVNAYDTLQEVLWMERRVLPFAPDVIVLQYYVNDTASRGEGDTAPDLDALLSWVHPRRGGVVGWVRRNSRFAELIFDSLYRRRGLAVYSDQRMAGYREDSPGWQRVVEGLRRARDELETKNIEFVVALYPFLVREGDHLTSHAAFELVKALCARERIACFDAEPAFEAHDIDELRISPQDYHGNARAHAIFADAVAHWLIESGLVP